MISARRPVKRSELESGIVLDKNTTQINDETRIHRDALGLCSPLLDLHATAIGNVPFTHFTARE